MTGHKRYRNWVLRKILLFATASLVIFGCVRSWEGFEEVDAPEGEPATISLTVTLPDMAAVTRNAGIDPDGNDSHRVEDLWVGVYNVSTGNKVGSGVFSGSLNSEHTQYGRITLSGIKVFSGRCYIVAVANTSNNHGMDVSKENGDSPMIDLLEAADTWQDYKRIAAVMPEPQSLVRAGSSLMLSGAYSPNRGTGSGHGNDDDVDGNGNPSAVTIVPGQNNLSGSIHLRRLDSYVRFNIMAAPYVTVEPVSWQVCNLPGISYVFEQGSDNAADLPIGANHIWNNRYDPNDPTTNVDFNSSYYHNSRIYEANTFEPIRDLSGKEGVFLEFYQMENKHSGIILDEGRTGLPSLYYYNKRELEFKNSSSLNTGWYQSLVSSPGESDPAVPTSGVWKNNNASYVILKTRVSYYYDGSTEVTRNEAKPIDISGYDPNNLPDWIVRRVGDAVYTIHLGYCEGDNDFVKSNDFNCRRNTKYTYNVTINGVNNIKVEAERGDYEPQTGAEGTVTDLFSTLINLDAHYGVFNVKLSDNDRKTLIWRIQAQFGSNYVDMVAGERADVVFGNSINLAKEKDRYDALPENQFYNWIQIRPTTGENIIAHYPGDPRLIGRTIPSDDPENVVTPEDDPNKHYPTSTILDYAHLDTDGRTVISPNGIWYLEQLRDPDHFPHPDSRPGESPDTDHWYTVFVDEYVYEYPYDASKPSFTGREADENVMNPTERYPIPNTGIYPRKESGILYIDKWWNFVNRDSRKLWLGLSQKNISRDTESIYADAAYLVSQESIQTYYSENATQGIGVESTNESYTGERLGWTDYYILTEGGFYQTGSYHQYDGLLNQYSYVKNYGAVGSTLSWGDVLTAVDGTNAWEYGMQTHQFRKGTYRIGTTVQPAGSMTYYIPDHGNDFMKACLARNRDLNNDGIIGANEIRWYLPTDATYTRMVLGSVSLRSPLFNLTEFDPGDPAIVAGTGTGYSHYAASNHRQIWAEELAATGNLGNAAALRCIRNLGQHTNLTPDDDGDNYASIDQAYHLDSEHQIIELDYYKNQALRPSTTGFIPSHTIGDIRSYASAKFKYAKEKCIPYNYTWPYWTGNTNVAEVTYQDRSAVTRTVSLDENGGIMGVIWAYPDGWTVSLDRNAICGGYREDGDYTPGVWRVPNISELAIMYLLGVIMDGERYISCSREYFGNNAAFDHRFMNVKSTEITASINDTRYVRCVKDIIE